MKKSENGRDRLSIEVLPKEHREIKAYAALHGQSIREYVLESIREKLRHEAEDKDLLDMTTHIGPVLRELWDNEKDAEYDKL